MLTLRLEIGHMVHIGDETTTLVVADTHDDLADLFLVRSGWGVDILEPMRRGDSEQISDDVRMIVKKIRNRDVTLVFEAPKSVSIQRSGMKKSEVVQSG